MPKGVSKSGIIPRDEVPGDPIVPVSEGTFDSSLPPPPPPIEQDDPVKTEKVEKQSPSFPSSQNEQQQSFFPDTETEEKTGSPPEKKRNDENSEQRENKEEKSSRKTNSKKKRSLGDVMVMEKMLIPHPANREGEHDKMELYRIVEESFVKGQSPADVERWLVEQVESNNGVVGSGEFLIIRRVKNLRVELVRKVSIQEIEG